MHAERDLLARFAFPQLRQRFLERGVDIGEVDLRWGVTEDEVNTGDLLPRCLAEIDRCRPYFIAVLGERYGWVPEHIDERTLGRWPFLREVAGRSVTELEITYGALRQGTNSHALFFFREPSYLEYVAPTEQEDFRAEDPEAVARARDLRSRIRASGFPVTGYPTPEVFAYQALEQLGALLEADLPPREQVSGAASAETLVQEQYIGALAAQVIERPRCYAAIDSHLASSSAPLVVVGEPGIGKSALLALWVRRRRETQPDDIVIFHSTEASSVSAHSDFSIARLLTELARRLHAGPSSAESRSIDKQVQHMVAQWQADSRRRDAPIVVFDSADRFRVGFASEEAWWPSDDFAPACRVISSATELLPPAPSEPAEHVVRLAGLDVDERRALASTFLSWYGKRLAENAMDLITHAEQAASPRYLIALLRELRIFGDHQTLLERLRWYLAGPTLVELYERILARMELDYERDHPGLVRNALCLIWASRRGIAEKDLLSLLGTSSGALPAEWWAPIRVTLNDAFSSRLNRLQFANDAIREAVRRRYVSDSKDAVPFHRQLGLFLLMELDERIKTLVPGRVSISSDPGIEEEMLWQLSAGERWSELASFLADPGWLTDLWRRGREDVLTYWRRIEEHSAIRIAQTYATHVADPSRYGVWPDPFVAISELLVATGHQEMVQRALDRLAEASADDADGDTVIPSLRSSVLKVLGDWEAALEDLEQQEQGFRQFNQHALLERALRSQGDLLVEQLRFSDALDRFREGEAICRAHGLADALMENLRSQINPLLRCGLISQAEARERMETYTLQKLHLGS